MSQAQLLSTLKGCAFVIATINTPDRIALCAALLSCEKHGGVHHFAIVGEGKLIMVSKTAVQCLRDQGVTL